jgi:hypothetical protein
MLRRFAFVGVWVLALVCVSGTSGFAHAQHGRGSPHSVSRSSFRPGFQPSSRSFSRHELDGHLNRFGDRLEKRLPFNRFEERFETRFPFTLSPRFGFGFGGFGFPGFFPSFGFGFPGFF